MKKKKPQPEPQRGGIIAVLPLGNVGQDILRVVADSLQGSLKLPVDLLAAIPIPDDAFMEFRNQYNAMAIIRFMKENHTKSMKTIGITGKDLCNPILTYVFGEAYMDGASAVMSYHRLHQGPDGDPVSREQFLDRVVKVALHEIGHTFGLSHCHTGRCVMRASNNLNEVDEKLNYLCDYCELFLHEAVERVLASNSSDEDEIISEISR